MKRKKGVIMNAEQKRYVIVFTGLLLIFLGGILFLNKPSESEKTMIVKTISKVTEEKSSNQFVPYERPTKLNHTYYSELSISSDEGIKEYDGDKYMDEFRVVCSGKNCKKQILTSKNSFVFNKTSSHKKKVEVVKKDVVFSKGNLNHLKENVKIVGNLYVKDINFLKIPKNFKVIGNVYVINSEGLTFMGNNFIDGHIYVQGKGSIRAFPKTVRMTGQIFI